MKTLKRLPIDFGQYEMRYKTKGKKIAFALVPMSSGGKALDLGCRDGYWTERLKGMGYQVTSIDVKPCYPGALTMDANQRIPFPDAEFDLIWCTEVIEHLQNAIYSLGEMVRMLRPGGSLVLTTPNSGFWVFRALAAVGITEASIQNEEHQQFFEFHSFPKILGIVEQFGYFPYIGPKFTIRKNAAQLSPTIVMHYVKAVSI